MSSSPRRLTGWLPPGLPRLPLVARLPRVASAAVALLLLVGVQAPAVASASRGDVIRLFVRSPVLVRSGERVQIPVDAVCATPRGRVCSATVSLRYRSSDGTWRSANANA